ncbi:hypothetical protein P4O66_014614 [Electrophorus voltai]|uniref:Uncharacterized protein n=1 Tax=Electrophorus voltai TaxID=2609070 RepID=A0AAD8Z3F5_9TELE|nr:hypothetical protein P4O66_014614 [Electrophorus voltai]
MNRRVCAAFGLLVVHNEFFGLFGVEGEVIGGTPGCQMLDLLPVGCFIIIADMSSANLMMMLDKCRGTQLWVYKEKSRDLNTALWHASVQNEAGGHVTAQPHSLGSVG